MIKILHLQPELNLACGITRTISQIVNNSSTHIEHHIIALGGNGFSRFQSIKVHLKIIERHRNTFFNSILILYQIASYIKKNSIEVLHCHHRYFDSLVWLIKLFSKVKIITSVQSKVFGKKKISYKADILIACSESIKNHLINNFIVEQNRIKVIYNMVDTNQDVKVESSVTTKKELQIADSEFVIGFVGRLNYQEKGIDTLLLAFKDLTQNYNNFKLLILGDGIDNSKIQQFIESDKLNAKLLSSVKNIFPYYKLMDVLIVPSKIEPFGIVIIEAGMMKKTVIASNVDGIPELISNGENGLLFESGNVEELKAQIIRIYSDRKFGEKLAENLNKKVLDSFTADKIIPQYEKLYSELLVE